MCGACSCGSPSPEQPQLKKRTCPILCAHTCILPLPRWEVIRHYLGKTIACTSCKVSILNQLHRGSKNHDAAGTSDTSVLFVAAPSLQRQVHRPARPAMRACQCAML